MNGRQRPHTSSHETHPAARFGLIALIQADPGSISLAPERSGSEALESLAAQIQPLLRTLAQQDRSGEAALALVQLQPGQERVFRDLMRGPGLIPVTRDAQPAAEPEPLTGREQEVLALVAAGFSNQQIADRLFLSLGTVKQHLHHINGKLGATSRTSALARAREAGIL